MKGLAIFRRRTGPIVYEVRLDIDSAIEGDFDDWLLEHAREMLAFPGFQSATVHGAHEPGESRHARLVVYEVRSRRELDSYLHTHAARMRKDGVKRFGKRFAATRRILPAAEYVLPEGFAALYDSQHISGGLPICGNCHSPVPGRFCVNCGQEDRTYVMSLRELIHDFIGDLFNYDSRFLRTMKPLLLQPGMVTVEYLRGRRQAYLPPVRMYIFASLIFFFVIALLAQTGIDESVDASFPGDAASVELDRELTPDERETVERELDRAEQLAGLPPGTLALPEQAPQNGAEGSSEAEPSANDQADDDTSGFDISLGSLATDGLEGRLEQGARALSDEPGRFAQTVIQQIPTVMLFFLPLIALVLKVLYFLSGRYYVEHLIFTLHFHSAVFILLLLWILYGLAEPVSGILQALSGWFTAALWIYLLYYLYKSMRRVYGQGRFVTILKYVLLLFAYFIALIITATLTLLYTLYVEA